MSENEFVVSVEELCARKTVKKVVGRSDQEQSPGAGVVITETQTKVNTVFNEGESDFSGIQDWKELVAMDRENTSTTATASETNSPKKPKPKIQKVPMVLRGHKKFAKYYEPRVVSIGPIHHRKKFMLADYKPNFLVKFIKDSCKPIEVLYKPIKDGISELRKLFDEEVIETYDDETLSRMLFLDGCFILKFIESYVNRKLETFDIKNDQAVYAQQDLFLLENQIPFLVLKLLMESSCDEFRSKLKSSIENFIRLNVMAPTERKQRLVLFTLDKEPDPTHLLELLQKAETIKLPGENGMPSANTTTEQSFRNVQELQAAGIDLKRSKSCSLIDITFSSSFCFRGLLKLPPLLVDDSTGPKFFNLIAYEMCPGNFRTDYEVTSYLSFMDSLIDDSNDVKQLRSAKILRNLLGCDDEVASLFNEIATDLVPSPVLYRNVKAQIQNQYDRKFATWMAEGLKTHFSTPWTILAFVGAVLALAMSGIQTWFTIHPAD